MIGSRISLSCHKVAKWWMKIIQFFLKTQKLTLDEQLKAGVRLFDFTLRLSSDMGKIMCFCQGPIEFTDSVRKTFYKLNKYKGVIARVQFVIKDELDIPLYLEYAQLLKNKYKRIRFVGGQSNRSTFNCNYEDVSILEVNMKASQAAAKFKNSYILANFIENTTK